MPPEITKLVDLMEDDLVEAARAVAGDRECHLVGGIVRDRLLDRPSPDLDLVVAGEGLLFSRSLASRLDARLVHLGRARFSAFRLVGDEFVIDVWGRGEASLYADLQRRDLTINAMALDVHSGELRDPFDGLEHLAARLLKSVGSRSFTEDPLRVLRLARFATQLPGFTIDPGTLELARASSAGLEQVAPERQREELGQALACGSPAASVDLLLRIGALQSLLAIESLEDDGERLLAALRRLERLERRARDVLYATPARDLCVYALISTVLPVDRGGGEGLAAAGLVTRKQSRAIGRLRSAAHPPLDDEPRAFLARWGDLWLEAATVGFSLEANASMEHFNDWIGTAGALIEIEGSTVLDPPPLLNGHELTELLAIREGPLVGELIDLLREAQIAGQVATRDEAIEILPDLLASARQR